MKIAVPIFAFAALAMFSCQNTTNTTDYASYVDPFIGTGGHGHTFPGAVVPPGMIQPSPDTRVHGWDACSGYHYSDSTINGFTQTHLSGTGCADYGDFLIIPTTGAQKIDPQLNHESVRPYASTFSHDAEIAEPGYYSVQLDTYGIGTEIASTERAAIYRFTYPAHSEPGVIVDLDYSIQNQRNNDMQVEIVGDNAIKAWKSTSYWAGDQSLAMYAEFSKPFTATIVRDTVTDTDGAVYPRCKALLKFAPTTQGEQIDMKIAVSGVDTEGAERNLAAEIPDWNFNKVRTDARQKWNDWLGKIDVQSDNDTDRRIFYTALYHSAISPNLYTDVDGRYFGMDHKPHQGNPDKPVYTIFSLWDTFRALHPMLTIIDPELNNNLINSLLSKYEEGGILPKWELAANYTAEMTGYHAVSLMADAISKGIADFDIDKAKRAAIRSAIYDPDSICASPRIRELLSPISKKYKNDLGFIPWDAEKESVAKGLEYAYDDYCVSVIAEAAGDTATAKEYYAKSKAYKEYFDPETRFMRGKDIEGKWHEPFNPRSSTHRADDYCEGTAWQWTWYTPHDVAGLIELMGGKEPFVHKLDSLFTADSALEGDVSSPDISGLIGQYAHGNEPSHHIIHLYNYAGRPDRTQENADRVLKEMYSDKIDGIAGNEDCGQMSAWYVLNALGFYQVAPGIPTYSIGRPWFPKATINLPNGKKVNITVKNYGKDNKYIKSMKLNGKEMPEPFFTHEDIVNGADFEFEMSATPSL